MQLEAVSPALRPVRSSSAPPASLSVIVTDPVAKALPGLLVVPENALHVAMRVATTTRTPIVTAVATTRRRPPRRPGRDGTSDGARIIRSDRNDRPEAEALQPIRSAISGGE